MVNNVLSDYNLNLLNWNANGLKEKKSVFLDFLLRHNIDIACVSETHFIPTQQFKIGGYNIYRTDRLAPHASGGVAIFIKRNIKHYEIILPELTSIEAVAINLILSNEEVVTISAVYKAPNKRLHSSDLDHLFHQNNASLIIGDLNCKHVFWNCRVSNPNGERLFNYVTNNDIFISSPSEPTHFPQQLRCEPDILDIVLFKNFNMPINQNVLPELDSDHSPVVINFCAEHETVQYIERLINGQVDWDLFQSELDKLIPEAGPLSNIEDIDITIDLFTESVKHAVNSSTVKVYQRKRHSYFHPPTRILQLIKLKHSIRHRWQRNRTQDLKNQLNRLTRQVKFELDKYRISSYKDYLSEIHPGDHNMWQATKRVLRKPTIIPPLIVGNDTFQSDSEKANSLADFYENVCTPNVTNDPDTDNMVEEQINAQIPTVELPTEYTSIPEVSKFIKHLPLRKSPGHDLITNVILKKLSHKSLKLLVSVLNACIFYGYFPTSWKFAQIIVFHKPGKPASAPSSYRPISLLPTMSKLLEHIIKKRLVRYMNDSNITPPHQFGFREKHSTTHQLLRITKTIVSGFEQKKYTTAAFLDVAQAFDKVWHKGLLFKISQIGTPKYLQRILASFLLNRSFVVKINSCFSTVREISAGVPQGSVLGPILFNIYMYDITIPNAATLALFADDTAIITQSSDLLDARNQLQECVAETANWFYKWKIFLNSSKCETKVFALRRTHIIPEILINNINIVWNPDDQGIKYLGLYMDKKLNWNFHVNKKLTEAYVRLAQLYPIINRKLTLKSECSLLMYKSLIRPLLMYACQVWGAALSKSKFKKIQIFQNKILRIAVNAPWFVRNSQLHRELQIDSVENHISTLTKRFMEKLQHVPGAITFQIGEETVNRRLKPRLPQDIGLN